MGKLYRNDLQKYKNYFKEAADLLGVEVEYKYIVSRNTENATGESIYSELSKPIKCSVIVEQGLPMIDSLKQLGWFVDTSAEQILVDFSTDTPNLQEGCRIVIRSNENEGQYKEYVVTKLSNNILYPTLIKCLCQPIYESETTHNKYDNSLNYGQQPITSDDENMTFISEKPQLTFF